MVFALASLLLAAGVAEEATETVHTPRAFYKTAKELPALEKCLTHALSGRGEVTSATIDGTTTLMLRERPDTPPMLIDLAPPAVTVTTRFAVGTRHLVESCL